MGFESGKWYEIPDRDDGLFPFDGQAVWLTENGTDMHAGYWRKTRTYDGANVKWVTDAFWAQRNAGGQKLDLNPVAFMKMDE